MDGWMDGYGMDGWMDTAWMTFDNFRRLPTTSDDFRRARDGIFPCTRKISSS